MRALTVLSLCGLLATAVPAMAAETNVERLQQLLAAEPASPSACLEMLDSVQVRAEEIVTAAKMPEADVGKIGAMIQDVEAKCQGGLFKDAWTAAVTLKGIVDPEPPKP